MLRTSEYNVDNMTAADSACSTKSLICIQKCQHRLYILSNFFKSIPSPSAIN